MKAGSELGIVGLIARREITTRTQSKGFRIGLGITLVLIIAAVVLPTVLGHHGPTRYQVGLAVGASSGDLRSALATQAKARGVQLTVHDVLAGADVRAQVKNGDLDAAVIDGRLLAGSADDGVVPVVQAAAASAQVDARLQAAGLDPAQVGQALSVTPLPLTTIDSGQNTQRQVVATVTIVFFFAQLITFCTWVATGVVEEKTSRVVELLLGAVRPVQLLAGKIIGIGTVAVGQALLLGAVALGAAQLSGALSLPGSIYGTVAGCFVWFVLGFLFFAALAAALASTVSLQEEVGGVLTPMTVLLFLAYGGSFAAASNPDATIARLASIVPPFSSLAMPGRLARGGVPVWQVALAAVLMLLATAAVLAAGSRVYRASILSTGRKLSIRKAWRGEAVASGR